MAEATPTQTPTHAPEQQLDQGTYQVIRQRLDGLAQQLRGRVDQLNTARREVFGGIELKLLGSDRIATPHNCIPRDIVALGDRFLFGFNVQFGLKLQITTPDVFAAYRFAEGHFHELPLDLLINEAFEKDFSDLYRYYKDTRFGRFFKAEPNLYMKFRVGKDADAFKAFKWAIADSGDGTTLHYLDARSDHEVRYPRQSPFDWQRATRDMQRPGEHPHLSIEDQVFVECVGGDLTIKVEDNTTSGQGIYSEPVDNADQTLDDAEVHYVVVGPMILLRIKPFQERQARHFIFNTKTQEVVRQDAIASACQLLPEDHGIIFPTGYYLESGLAQTFPNTLANSIYERTVVSPNGEDFLFVFYERDGGHYTLMPYNLIERRVDTPIICQGYCLFDDGTLILFKSHEQAQKHHAVQVWQTPFHDPDHQVQTPHSDSTLYKVGNRDVVRAMAQCAQLLQLIGRGDLYQDLYLDIVRTASTLLDAYHWIDDEACFNLGEVVGQIRDAGQAAVGEYEKLLRTQAATSKATREVQDKTTELIRANAARIYDRIEPFVDSLAGLRRMRGEVIALRELKYADNALIDQLEAEIDEQTTQLSHRTVAFLIDPASLEPYRQQAAGFASQIDALQTVQQTKKLGEDIAGSADALEMLIEIVGNLEIEDATQRTEIVDRISAIFATINAARSSLKNKRSELGKTEGAAEFASQLKLISQSVTNFLDLCDSPEVTDDYLTRVLVQIEELEGKFAEFDDFVIELADKRNEVVQAFEARKVMLQEQRNKRAGALAQAADRVLTGIRNRVERMDSVNDINSYLAGDLMIDKVRDLIDQLKDLGDTVKADDIQSRLKTIREDAVRQLKDKQDLQADGVNTIRFGRHVFSVNTQPIDLTTAQRDGRMLLHLTGTRFYEPITDADLLATSGVWSQELISENDRVYRAEYLAWLMLQEFESLDASERDAILHRDEAEHLEHVQKFMAPRYREGYVKGVHDIDAAKLFIQLIDLSEKAGLLRYATGPRALASVFWQTLDDSDTRERLAQQLAGFGQVVANFPDTGRQAMYLDELRRLIADYAQTLPPFADVSTAQAAAYLFDELTRPTTAAQANSFIVSPEATDLTHAFITHLKATKSLAGYQQSIDSVTQPTRRFLLIRDWVAAFAHSQSDPAIHPYIDEAAAALLEATQRPNASRLIDVSVRRDITGLVGAHPRIKQGAMTLDFHDFQHRMEVFVTQTVPAFEQFEAAKKRVVAEARQRMRVDEFEPKVLSSFVRNQLVDQVFLPLIGDNLAKQMGTADANTRTDRMGLLLLISPPGYGKTTIMEYVAARLGVVFMKINGPALGHSVTSLDPTEAPNAAAREEIQKLNLAFEMGDNIVIYIDDIQHTNPEFLQKFISLCDGTRRIEGVYNGQTRTYDLRGRKVAVVMAGNPYTESGEKFRLPDMLTNRADTYNLGDIIGSHGPAFKASYLENCLTSNPALNELASCPQKDVQAIIKMAETGSREGIDLESNLSGDQVDEMVAVMERLVKVRDVILRVNQQYIASAGMEDEYRTEPPFLLQGSYRNMNRIAERVVGVMNDEELTTLIQSTYEQDAQTLTSGAEANLLKFKSLFGWLSNEEKHRFDEIVKRFARNNAVRSMGGDDRTAAVIAQIASLSDHLATIDRTLATGLAPSVTTTATPPPAPAIDLTPLSDRFVALAEGLSAIRETLERRVENSSQPPTALPASSPQPATPTPPLPPQEIRVINKVPATFLYIIKEQFNLMQNWFEPLAKTDAEKADPWSKLHQQMVDLLQHYQQIMVRLENNPLPDDEEALDIDG